MGSDTWNMVKDMLGKSAPVIGTLLGGPAGGAMGTIISSALGVEDTPEAIERELKNNPEALVKVRELEVTHKTRLEELALEDTRAHLADRQDARKAEVERMKAGSSNRFMYTLAALVVVAFLAIVAVVLFVEIPASTEKIAYMLLGTLAAEFGSIMRYFFGSSKGSSDKTALIAGKAGPGQ